MSRRGKQLQKLIKQMTQKKKKKPLKKSSRVVALEGKRFFKRGGKAK
tara:strand:- start:328 stop:468 length:141 start_codon:yes stop_codon:yes gene_type:complete